MPTTKTDIANGALVKLGSSIITSITDTSKEAVRCNARFDPCRRAVLRLHPWKFAKKRVVLSPLSTAPAFDFTYQHPLPADCLRVLEVDKHLGTHHRVENNHILTDSDEINLLYIYDHETVVQWDSLFTECLSLYLAHDIAYGIVQDSGVKDRLWIDFERVLARARFVDATEGPAGVLESGEFLDARLAGEAGIVHGTV